MNDIGPNMQHAWSASGQHPNDPDAVLCQVSSTSACCSARGQPQVVLLTSATKHNRVRMQFIYCKTGTPFIDVFVQPDGVQHSERSFAQQ
jgi:hypothetical protein